MDREKVIKGLAEIIDQEHECWLTIPQYEIVHDAIALLKEDCHNCKLECLLQKYDELKEKYDALLKEQEAVEPQLSISGMWYECPICHRHLIKDRDNYCARCGRRLKWK